MFATLRTKIVLLLASAGLVAMFAAALTVYGLSNAQTLVDRAQAAQTRIEHLLVLASRMSDYRDAATATVIAARKEEAAERLKPAQEAARQAFTRLLSLNVMEVDNADGDGKSVAGTKGLLLARMRAQFDHLHRSVSGLVQKDGAADTLQVALDQFGLAFAPMLARLMEEERMLSATTHHEISTLRQRLFTIAAALCLVTIALIAAVYLFIGRPLLQRTDELHTVNQQLADIDANRRRFFSDISHELRTPLTVVQGEAEYNFKAKTMPGADDMRESFSTIRTRVIELRQRIDDMLRVARSESGKLDLSFEAVDLNDVAKLAADGERRFCERNGMEVRVEPDTDPVVVEGDADWLRQVIAGTIINAVKFSEHGSSVQLTVDRKHGHGIVSITDRGCGLADEDIARVFERFARAGKMAGTAQDVTVARDGFGVGLSLAKWVVEQHGGTISLANNADGPGLTVQISLPLSDARTPKNKAVG